MNDKTELPTRDGSDLLIEMASEGEATTLDKFNYAQALLMGCAENLGDKERCELLGCLHRVFELLHSRPKEAA